MVSTLAQAAGGDPTTSSKIRALTVAAHWGDEIANDPDADLPMEDDTAVTAWLAYQALTALHDIAPDVADAICRQLDNGVDVSEYAHDALGRIAPDPQWTHQPFDTALAEAAA